MATRGGEVPNARAAGRPEEAGREPDPTPARHSPGEESEKRLDAIR